VLVACIPTSESIWLFYELILMFKICILKMLPLAEGKMAFSREELPLFHFEK
jgi:hypothetical protein